LSSFVILDNHGTDKKRNKAANWEEIDDHSYNLQGFP